MQLTRESVLLALHSFGSQKVWSTVRGDLVYGRLAPTKEIVRRLNAPRSRVVPFLNDLLGEGLLGFSGRGRHAGWTLNDKGYAAADLLAQGLASAVAPTGRPTEGSP